jgi:hypothetical protein
MKRLGTTTFIILIYGKRGLTKIDKNVPVNSMKKGSSRDLEATLGPGLRAR